MHELIHAFLQQKKYTCIDVPVMSPVLIPESYLEVYETEYRSMNHTKKFYLTPSPELFLKRAIAKGAGSVYALTKTFRNSEPESSRHSGEFTMLEFYKVEADYMDVADDVLSLFNYIARELLHSETITYKNETIKLDSWEKITVAEAFEKYAGMKTVHQPTAFLKEAEKKGYVVKKFSYTDVWSQIYTQEVEPHLGFSGRPTLIYEYPVELAAMVQVNQKKHIAERFEAYIAGVELGNCGNEAYEGADWDEFEKRIQNEDTARRETGKIIYPPDSEFISILKQLPRCSGIAIGVERLAMIFTNVQSIADLKIFNF